MRNSPSLHIPLYVMCKVEQDISWRINRRQINSLTPLLWHLSRIEDSRISLFYLCSVLFVLTLGLRECLPRLTEALSNHSTNCVEFLDRYLQTNLFSTLSPLSTFTHGMYSEYKVYSYENPTWYSFGWSSLSWPHLFIKQNFGMKGATDIIKISKCHCLQGIPYTNIIRMKVRKPNESARGKTCTFTISWAF